ncbi:Protein LURP-one-related like [Quillaja saponaria]|uniref:Protein LURP-one-related like n=1 Tax=Quillaja saponaria TaxID=32244 RepID=A0AAD7L7L6_QUISA|nr:Protein LURP-one-related like [Quillaja saponaria]
MAKKVHPHGMEAIDNFMTSKKETFTVWMKSLVCNSNGCTIYNSKGQIVYRVDNYDKKCSREVHLMDFHGNILFTITHRFLAFGRWDGYSNSEKKEKPYFQVQRYCKLVMRNTVCQIKVASATYWILRSSAAKVAFTIVDVDGDIVAQAKQKLQSSSEVVLGDDVVTLEVKSDVDHSLIMALVTVYGLIRRRM